MHEARRCSEGDRVLDVGCGWGSFALHAATRHGAHVTGITLSSDQAATARRRVAEAGLEDRVDIRLARLPRPRGEGFDAVASIGMVEHVGEERIDVYASTLAAVLRPGGRLLNHGIARLRHADAGARPFSERYVFPDAEPLPLSRVLLALERAGFVIEHVEGFAPDYAETLRHWARATSTTAWKTRSRSRGRSACASGGSTCVRRATASSPASRASTRSARARLGRHRRPVRRRKRRASNSPPSVASRARHAWSAATTDGQNCWPDSDSISSIASRSGAPGGRAGRS